MPIFDQGYQHWQGRLYSSRWRWWPIARRGAAIALKNLWMRLLILSALTPALALGAALAFWGLVEQQASWADFVLKLFGLPETVLSDRPRMRNIVWTLAFHIFLHIEFFFTVVLVLLAGPGLIGQDLRFNAIPLYFSKPVRRIDYFLGKLGVIGLLIGSVVFVPALVAYVLGVAFSLDPRVIPATLGILVGALLFGVVMVLSAGTLMLAISSLSRNSQVVGAIWVALFFVSWLFSESLQTQLRKPWAKLLSYPGDLLRVEARLLNVPLAFRQILNLREEVMVQTQQMMNSSQFGPFGRRVGPQRFQNDPARRPPGQMNGGRTPITWLEEQSDPDPWWWSAAVLAGLFCASLFVLSRRVRSLDRLK